MIALKELENEVRNLHKQDFIQFRDWFLDYENSKWDKEIEEDIYSEKLDDIMNNAKNIFKMVIMKIYEAFYFPFILEQL